MLSDRHKSPFGRRRPFIFFGSMVGLMGMAMMSFGSLALHAIFYTVGLLVSMLAMNTIYTVQTSIVPDALSDRKGEASGLVAGLSQGGNLLGMVWIIGSTGIAYQWSYALFIAMMITAGVIVCLATQEQPTDRDRVAPVTLESLKGAFWLDWQKERDFTWVFVGRTFYYMSVSVQTFLYYYLRDMLRLESEAVIRWQLAVLVIVAMAFAILV